MSHRGATGGLDGMDGSLVGVKYKAPIVLRIMNLRSAVNFAFLIRLDRVNCANSALTAVQNGEK